MSLWEYIGSGTGITKGLYHLNGNANDSSGNSINGTATGTGFSWTKWFVWNGASKFTNNGAAGIAIDFWKTGLPLTTNMTIAFSRTQTVASNGNNNRIIAKWNNAELNSYILYMTASNHLVIIIVNSAATRKDFDTTFIPSLNVWYNYVVTWNGTTITLYINGSYFNSTSFSWTGWANTNLYTVIGNYKTSGGSLWAPTVDNSIIDELIIENVAWSAEKVRKYNTFLMGRLATL